MGLDIILNLLTVPGEMLRHPTPVLPVHATKDILRIVDVFGLLIRVL